MNIKTQFINDLNNKLNLNPNFDDIKNKINVFQYIKEENKNTNLFYKCLDYLIEKGTISGDELLELLKDKPTKNKTETKTKNKK